MELLATLDPHGYQNLAYEKPWRIAARAVAFSETGKIAIISVTKLGYYKLPGGGIEPGEDVCSALVREFREETGYDLEVLQEIGEISEYREKDFRQKSLCFFGDAKRKLGPPSYTKLESSRGYKLEWMSLGKTISSMKKCKPADENGRFVLERDLVFLTKAEELLNHF